MIARKIEKKRLSLGSVHLVYWTWSDSDACLKMDVVIILTGPVLLDTGPKLDPKNYLSVSLYGTLLSVDFMIYYVQLACARYACTGEILLAR